MPRRDLERAQRRGIMMRLNPSRRYEPLRLPALFGGVALLCCVTVGYGQAAPPSGGLDATAAQAAGRGLSADFGEAPAFAGRVDPETYRIGPGDELAFRSSDLLDPKILRVGPTGELLLPDAGAIQVAGLTLSELDARAREILRPFIRGKGFVLTLHRPRRFRAVVVGDVANPGAVLVQAPVRAADVIAAAGGVSATGARRGILVRRGEDSLWVDLVRFDRTGDRDANPLVFETDVIVIPPISRRVEIGGAVAHSGWYDLAPGDRATTLVAVAGGALPQAALASAEWSRAEADTPPEHQALDLAAALAAPGGPEDPLLEPGDRIFVPAIAHWRESARAVVEGEVARPGPYSIADGVDRVSALLERAGGLTEWADRASIRIERATDGALRDSAFLRLAREQEGVLPAGERDYLIAVTRERRALSIATEGEDVVLLDGDRIVVPRRALTVMVQGEVKAPGHVPFVEGRNVSDYIRAAGGYTSRANKSRARVTLAATGRPVGASDAGPLRAGDIVWVPAKEPGNVWGTVRDVLTTAAQVATIYLVVREATK